MHELWRFLGRHRKCGENVIVAATDIAPNVIRLDCMVCLTNVQVPYFEDTKNMKPNRCECGHEVDEHRRSSGLQHWACHYCSCENFHFSAEATAQGRPESRVVRPGKEDAAAFVEACSDKVRQGGTLDYLEAGGLIQLAKGNPHVYEPAPTTEAEAGEDEWETMVHEGSEAWLALPVEQRRAAVALIREGEGAAAPDVKREVASAYARKLDTEIMSEAGSTGREKLEKNLTDALREYVMAAGDSDSRAHEHQRASGRLARAFIAALFLGIEERGGPREELKESE